MKMKMSSLQKIITEEILKELNVSDDEIIDFMEDISVKLIRSKKYEKEGLAVDKAIDHVEAGRFKKALTSLEPLAKMNDELLTHLYPIVSFLKDKEEDVPSTPAAMPPNAMPKARPRTPDQFGTRIHEE